MKGIAVLRKVSLPSWACLGLTALLCFAWFLPTKHYHQAIIALLWLPVIPALFRADFRAALKQPELALFGLFMAWTWLVLAIKGSDDLIGDYKVTLYVTLSLLGIVLASQARIRIETWLFGAALFGGVLSLASVAHFLLNPPPFGRVVALGVWNTAIMAAHAVGALALLAYFLRPTQRLPMWQLGLLAVAALGYVGFLVVNQTRGVWLALILTFVVMVVALRSRRGYALIALGVTAIAVVAVVCPDVLTQRGASARPTLWAGGLNLMLGNGVLGYGFNEYGIFVPELNRTFKHPHNLFLNIGAREGVIGLALYLMLWVSVAWRAWRNRTAPLGQAVLAIWVFATVSLMTDGIGVWLKPNADWLVTWLPIGLSLVLASRKLGQPKSV